MTKQITLEGKEAVQTKLLRREESEDIERYPYNEYAYIDPDLISYRDDIDRAEQVKAREFFRQHEKHPLDAEGYVRLPGPCGSTHLQPVKSIDYSKEPDCIRYFRCYRCGRRVDRAKERMWTWAPNQVLGLAVPTHNYCWGCYQIVRKGDKGLGGITGREFANVASKIINSRRREL